jgi:hypothetical protein
MTEDERKVSGGPASDDSPRSQKRELRGIDAFEKDLRRVPVLGTADDPLFSLALGLLAFLTVVALGVSLALHHGGQEVRDVTFKLAGGALLALGAYTAVRTIIGNRANSASQTFTGLLALLAADPRTADAARIGAIRHLPDLARRRGSDPDAIEAVIKQLQRSGSPSVKAAADTAHSKFPEPDERRAPDHRTP